MWRPTCSPALTRVEPAPLPGEDRAGRLLVAVPLGCMLAVFGVVLAVLESFLHPVRLFGIPVGVILAVLVNLAVAQLVGRAARSRLLALIPGAAWLLVVIVFAIGRPEGDFVVAANWIGYGYLIAGAVASIVGVLALPWYNLPLPGAPHGEGTPG